MIIDEDMGPEWSKLPAHLAPIEILERNLPGHRAGWEITPVACKAGWPIGFRAVVRAHDDANGRTLALKIGTETEPLRREHAAMCAVADLMPGAVRCLFSDAPTGAYAMEWRDGRTHLDLMPEAGRLDAITAAARWLREFQDKTRGEDKPHDFDADFLWLRRKRSGMKRRWRAFGPAFRELEVRCADVLRGTAPSAMIHGDFQLQNVMETPQGTVAVDVPRIRRSLVYEDVVRYLLSLELRRGLARIEGADWPGSVDEDRMAFFSGYGEIPRSLRALFHAMEDQALMRSWVQARRRADRYASFAGRMAIVNDMMSRRGLNGNPDAVRPVSTARTGLLGRIRRLKGT